MISVKVVDDEGKKGEQIRKEVKSKERLIRINVV